MKIGEKLQQLRKKSGLTQEQLAARLTVSRQAVSKWELDDAVPDTENVVQLSRIFGVSCDYLLREEVDEPDAVLVPAVQDPQYPAPSQAVQDPPQPAPPGETHLDEAGWTHNAFVLSMGLCALGLAVGLMSYRFGGHTVRPLVVGFMIQLLGVALFELATPRMGDCRRTARLSFYAIVCWLVFPIPQVLAFNWIFEHWGWWRGRPLQALTCYFAAYLLSSAAVTAVMLFLRRRVRSQT